MSIAKWLLAKKLGGGGGEAIIKRKTGNPIELTDAASAPMVKCVTAITGSQDLHGYLKPWAEGCGKQKLNMIADNIVVGKYIGDDGVEYSSQANFYYSAYISVKKLTDYTLSISDSVKYISFMEYDINKNFIKRTLYGTASTPVGKTATITTDANTAYILFGSNISTNPVTLDIIFAFTWMLAEGSTASEWEPYSNICPITAYTEGEIEVSDGDGNTTTHTTTYPSAIYRGSEDVVEGEVTSEWLAVDIGDLTWSYSPTNQRFSTTDLQSIIKLDTLDTPEEIRCSCFESNSSARGTSDLRDAIASMTNGTVLIRCMQYTDKDAFKAAFTGQKIAFTLETPTTSSVTPTNLPIKSLSGYNHIESSTGEMVVDYITNAYQNFVNTVESALPNTRKGGVKAMDIFLSLEKKDDDKAEVEKSEEKR